MNIAEVGGFVQETMMTLFNFINQLLMAFFEQIAPPEEVSRLQMEMS